MPPGVRQARPRWQQLRLESGDLDSLSEISEGVNVGRSFLARVVEVCSQLPKILVRFHGIHPNLLNIKNNAAQQMTHRAYRHFRIMRTRHIRFGAHFRGERIYALQ